MRRVALLEKYVVLDPFYCVFSVIELTGSESEGKMNIRVITPGLKFRIISIIRELLLSQRKTEMH